MIVMVQNRMKMGAGALLAALLLLLTGCFVTPGKFTSELVLTEPDRFTFTYEGEIFFLGLSSLAQMGAAAEEFEEEPCYKDASVEERPCSANEISSQRAQWEAEAETRVAEAKRKSEQLAAFMGGIDPNDPEATAQLVEHLQRQKGWERVVDKGDGVFDVRYSVNGELSHDFMFPLIEGFPPANPFVQMFLRDGDVVRVNAAGFGPQNDNPLGSGSGLGGLAALSALGGGNDSPAPQLPNIPQMEGTFTIITNGNIRANNTDEGAVSDANGERLVWEISPRTKSAPTALIDMSR